ncbi:MAG TPA: shikimate kinase [Geminicoccus sp.]|uniref:shikimate kinase n=1 Tax=Geminicoccus sp. TaxID=2024832 RepID=UPI002E3610A8|nr:shikimate kinase [Geminicoccus sp.]HEX2527770.1 shikimate kinase [Geminicoccus sp.]
MQNPPPEAREKLALTRHVVLVGLMGAGKSAVGRRLATLVGAPFTDADDAIVEAAGMSIPDIFASHGEPEFRAVERRVIARLLIGQPHFLALGGGAFMDPATRERVAARGFSVWLRADLDTLVARTSRKKGSRPLLDAGDPRAILADLMERRHPVYATADLTVDTGDQPLDVLAHDLVQRLRQHGILV